MDNGSGRKRAQVRLLLLILALLPFSSSAIEFEASVGRSEYCCKTDGIWWQSPLGFEGDLRPTAFRLGIAQEIGKGWHARAAFVDLGDATSSNWAVVPDDQFQNPTTAELGRFMASQHVRGVELGVSYRWALTSKIGVEPSVGQFFYRSQWRIAIYCPTLCAGNVPQEYWIFRYTSNTRRSPYVGATFSYGPAFVSLTRYQHIDGGGDPEPDIARGQFATGLTSGPVTTWMVGARATF